jgi:uncharacterized membrane protein YidH (DUF202 family)
MTPNRSYSKIVGSVLVAMGTVTVILAYIRYKPIENQLKEGYPGLNSKVLNIQGTITCEIMTVIGPHGNIDRYFQKAR